MKPRHRAAAFMATWAGLCPNAAFAAERACPVMTLEADAAFRQRWPDLLERIQGEFRVRSDVDACARVAVRVEDDTGISISVTLPDGRTAFRVTRSEDVIPTLQALLLVPEPPPNAPASRSQPTPAALHRPTHLDNTSRIDRDNPPLTAAPHQRATEPRELGFELSVITGARLGDGQFGVGAGALSFLEVHGWLVGFEGRVDSYGPLAGGDPETALELAVLAGRRFDFGSVALDLTAGPAVAMKGLAMSETDVVRADMTNSDANPAPPMPPPPADTAPSSGPVPRLLLGARLGFSPRSVFRPFVGIDGEVGPGRVANNADPSSARLPGFSVGLALGATVGTR